MFANEKQKKDLKDDIKKEDAGDKTNMPNNTGIPDVMKGQFENLSGFSFNDVRVHYNSEKPAQLQALAYTQGNQVHIGPGQEKHLGHELGHVVQQKEGRVQSTLQLQGVNVNDDAGLEKEADRIAEHVNSVQFVKDEGFLIKSNNNNGVHQMALAQAPPAAPTQVDISFTPTGAGNNLAGEAEIQNYALAHNQIVGSPPSVNPEGWNTIPLLLRRVHWVRFHMLNENFGGPGDNWRNLFPSSKLTNSGGDWRAFEERVKGKFAANKWIWCKVTADYPAAGPANPLGFPNNVSGEAKYYDGAAWRNIPGIDKPIPIPNFNGVNAATLAQMNTAGYWGFIPDANAALKTALAGLGNTIGNTTGLDIDQLADRISEAIDEDEAFPAMSNAQENALYNAVRGLNPQVYIVP